MKVEIPHVGSRRATLPLAGHIASRLLALPEPLVARLAGPEPIERDGRILNRRVQALLALGKMGGRDNVKRDPIQVRKELRQLSMLGMPRLRTVHASDRQIPGPAGRIPVRIYRRFLAGPRPPAIVYFHGGGWVAGDLESHDGSCRLLAEVTGCVVIAVDYRLAPENPFPAAIDDAAAAYRWVHANYDELSIEPGRVGVMGDSAGGNLTAALSLEMRDAGDVPPPVAQGLVYPAVDVEFRTPSHETVGLGFGLDRPAMEWFRSQYLPNRDDWRSPRVAPSFAENLSGVAPAIVVTAGFDPLRDDGRNYASALQAAGVPVRYRCYDDMIHGFFGMGLLPEGVAIAAEVCAAMGELMATR